MLVKHILSLFVYKILKSFRIVTWAPKRNFDLLFFIKIFRKMIYAYFYESIL